MDEVPSRFRIANCHFHIIPLRSSRRDIALPLITAAVDIAAIEGAFLLAYWLRFHSALADLIPVEKGFPPLLEYVQGSLFVIPVWVWLLASRGLYATRRNTHFSDEFFALVRIIVLGMLVVMAAAFFYRTFSFSRVVFAFLFATSVVFVSAGRALTLGLEHWWYRSGFDLKRVAIVGTGPAARRLIESLIRKPQLGYAVAGCVVVGPGTSPEGITVPILGSTDEIPALVRTHSIDQILIALEETDRRLVSALVRSCDGLNVEMMVMPDFVELLTSRSRMKDLDGTPFLGLKGFALNPWDAFVKRTFDIVASGFIIILISPILMLVAFAVKVTSTGPVFFAQERIGLDGSTFRVLKFRSMRVDAEKETGPVWAVKNDPRTTPIGKFLRRFSIDELPQLFNVLRGDMSLVGPRPERPHFVEQFKHEIPKYLERHRVKTGMTGWAQVNGMRGNAPIEERTRYDVYYVENWSLVFDLKIILKTIRAVLFGEDAY